jgi:hypothetical protein
LVAGVVGARAPSVPAATSALRRVPYTNEVVGTTATVSWATDRSQSTGSATWGPVVAGACTPVNRVTATYASITVGSTSEYQWTAVLPFGAAGAYCYRVQLGTVDLLGSDPSPVVTTAAPPGRAFSFAVVGDWGAGGTGEASVMHQIGASPASFVVTTGDNVYNSGTETEYGDLSQGYVFPSSYLPAIGSKPFFATEGNHGFSTNLPYLQDFPAPIAASTSGGRYRQESYCCISTVSGTKTYPSAWYAFDWGSARFYVLEAAWADSQGGYQGDFLGHWNGPVSGCGPCGAQLAWLTQDLAAHPGVLKFAFFHYPLHADSSSQGSDAYLTGATRLEGLLARNDVGIVFNGHAHIYERNTPQIAGAPLVSYVTGGGGAPLGGVSGCSAFDAYAIGSSSSCHAPKPASAANAYHFLLVTVNGGTVTVAPTDSTGRTFDVQTYAFGGGGGTDTTPPSTPSDLTATATAPTSVDLAWTPSMDDTGVTSYLITRDGASLAIVPGSTARYTDTTVAAGATVTYTVRAFDAAGNASDESAPATVTTPASSTTFTFTPTDDAYVDQTAPSSNFGASSRIVADGSPVNDALVRFVVTTGACPVASATLTLTVGTSSSDGSVRGGDLHATGTSWSEGLVTWANAPAAQPTTLASLGAVSGGATISIPVTAVVTGDGAVAFRLTNPSTDGARYFSKEGSATQQPKLVVTCR